MSLRNYQIQDVFHSSLVIPAQAGILKSKRTKRIRLRGNDGSFMVLGFGFLQTSLSMLGCIINSLSFHCLFHFLSAFSLVIASSMVVS
jgi:hypothetical protein